GESGRLYGAHAAATQSVARDDHPFGFRALRDPLHASGDQTELCLGRLLSVGRGVFHVSFLNFNYQLTWKKSISPAAAGLSKQAKISGTRWPAAITGCEG